MRHRVTCPACKAKIEIEVDSPEVGHTPAKGEKKTMASLTLASIEREIRRVYLRETGGAVKERVLLSDLRPKIGVQSGDFDQALLAMQKRGELVSLDNPMERTADVEAAALHIAGHPRHLVYFQR